jgi:hypothetical protein
LLPALKPPENWAAAACAKKANNAVKKMLFFMSKIDELIETQKVRCVDDGDLLRSCLKTVS